MPDTNLLHVCIKPNMEHIQREKNSIYDIQIICYILPTKCLFMYHTSV